MKKIEGGITAAKGFQAAGGAAGIKKQGVKDMALVYSEVPCVAAGTFTTNIVKAAPVKWDQEIVYNHPTAQAIVCNSGIANACTGEEGYGYCRKTAEAASAALSIPEDSVLVASTGVIGKQIPIDKIAAGVEMLKPQLAATREAAATAAQAIMTTDTEPKEVAVQIEIGGKTVTIGSMCKGSGMIHPNMCTMLSFVATDANISKEMLQKALSEVVPDTYNMVSVDGDTSTNDTVLLLANGLAGNPEITEENEDYKIFKEALFEVNKTQAMHIAGDGEGATALFEVTIQGAESKEQAVTLAKSVITSSMTSQNRFHPGKPDALADRQRFKKIKILCIQTVVIINHCHDTAVSTFPVTVFIFSAIEPVIFFISPYKNAGSILFQFIQNLQRSLRIGKLAQIIAQKNIRIHILLQRMRQTALQGDIVSMYI